MAPGREACGESIKQSQATVLWVQFVNIPDWRISCTLQCHPLSHSVQLPKKINLVASRVPYFLKPAGPTYCAVASLKLLGVLEKLPIPRRQGLLEWCVNRQVRRGVQHLAAPEYIDHGTFLILICRKVAGLVVLCRIRLQRTVWFCCGRVLCGIRGERPRPNPKLSCGRVSAFRRRLVVGVLDLCTPLQYKSDGFRTQHALCPAVLGNFRHAPTSPPPPPLRYHRLAIFWFVWLSLKGCRVPGPTQQAGRQLLLVLVGSYASSLGWAGPCGRSSSPAIPCILSKPNLR